jgi:hypothetical protein
MNYLLRASFILWVVANAALVGCGGNSVINHNVEPDRAIIRSTKLKYVKPDTEIAVHDVNDVKTLRSVFVPEPGKAHQRSPAMSMGSITFIIAKGDNESFNFGLTEWSRFGSNDEYPLSEEFRSVIKRVILAHSGQAAETTKTSH